MNTRPALPPAVGPDEKVVLFDGVCRLCAASVRFIIRHDRHRRFKLAAVQSREGRAILEWFGMPTEAFETMLLVEGPGMYTKSTAAIRIAARLPLPWPLLAAGWIVPAFIRNWLYDRVARNRYALFGKYDRCMLPGPDHDSRFLKADGA